MSSDQYVIQLKNLSKYFYLYKNNFERIKSIFFNKNQNIERFEALRNINLKIKKGECIGIIGKNGAGKSTLLQLISGIIKPTSGSIAVKGKISALLELGSGFNPEYTGIENIYQNGLLLGLTKQEIDNQLDDIIAFSDLGDFVYRSVKTYSSGMVMRLAFSVQAIINPDILIIDEALTVGDVKFQSKCFEKFKSLKKNNVTIIIVSHDMNTISNYCDKAYLISDGSLHSKGEPRKIIENYYALIYNNQKVTSYRNIDETKKITIHNDYYPSSFDPENCGRFGTGDCEIIGFGILHNDLKTEILKEGETYTFFEKIIFKKNCDHFAWGITFKDHKGQDIFGCSSRDSKESNYKFKKGYIGIFKISFKNYLGPGKYILHIGNANLNMDFQYDCIQKAAVYESITDKSIFEISLVNLFPEFHEPEVLEKMD